MATEEAHAQQQNKMWSPSSRSSRRWVGAVGGVEDAALFGWSFGAEVSSHVIASAQHWPLATIGFGVRLQKLASATRAGKRQVRLLRTAAQHTIQNVYSFTKLVVRFVTFTSCSEASSLVPTNQQLHCYTVTVT